MAVCAGVCTGNMNIRKCSTHTVHTHNHIYAESGHRLLHAKTRCRRPVLSPPFRAVEAEHHIRNEDQRVGDDDESYFRACAEETKRDCVYDSKRVDIPADCRPLLHITLFHKPTIQRQTDGFVHPAVSGGAERLKPRQRALTVIVLAFLPALSSIIAKQRGYI